MNVAHVFQENDAYCGPAVAQMVLRRFGVELTQTRIAKELETDMVVGTSAKELKKFFEKHGLKAERKNDAEWSELTAALEQGVVIVGYIEQGGDPHYALVRAVSDREITLIDPTHGDNFILAKDEFLRLWVDNEAAQYGNRMFLVVNRK
jgi:ABC-type bacteriocin/lantibiotic exporter with double-glycine peptidase domain